MVEKSLNNWSIVNSSINNKETSVSKTSNYESLKPGYCVSGELENGQRVITSKIKKVLYKNKVQTESGSTYVLLKASEGYRDWYNKVKCLSDDKSQDLGISRTWEI